MSGVRRDPDGTVWSNPEWAEDPTRLEAARRWHERQMETVAYLAESLGEMYQALEAMPTYDCDPTGNMLADVRRHVFTALLRTRDIRQDPASDARIRNGAAFGHGWTDQD